MVCISKRAPSRTMRPGRGLILRDAAKAPLLRMREPDEPRIK
jgi:hypothetical protein